MSKGFIFSVDALHAILLALLLANVLLLAAKPMPSDELPELMEFKANDSAQIGFLLGESPAELGAKKPVEGDYACKAVLSDGKKVYCRGLDGSRESGGLN